MTDVGEVALAMTPAGVGGAVGAGDGSQVGDARPEQLGGGRGVRRVDELLRGGLAARGRLTREELIAVVMYSGPMVQRLLSLGQ